MGAREDKTQGFELSILSKTSLSSLPCGQSKLDVESYKMFFPGGSKEIENIQASRKFCLREEQIIRSHKDTLLLCNIAPPVCYASPQGPKSNGIFSNKYTLAIAASSTESLRTLFHGNSKLAY